MVHIGSLYLTPFVETQIIKYPLYKRIFQTEFVDLNELYILIYIKIYV
jgi:hypothetical protein